MKTELLAASAQSIELVARHLIKGEIAAIPTETVYGLAANALCAAAVEKIFIAKNRPQDNPLIAHVNTVDMAGEIAYLNESAVKLAAAFWPGPLTIVLKSKGAVAPNVSAGLDTVAVRLPSNKIAQQVIAACGFPLAAPSANSSGLPSPTSAQHVLSDMNGKIAYVLDGGECALGLESTVLDLSGEKPCLLRPGFITAEQLEQCLGTPIALSSAITASLDECEKAASPGMKYKHYSPLAQITIIDGEDDAYYNYVNKHLGEHTYALCFNEDIKSISAPFVSLGPKNNPDEQAKRLFAALRLLDEKGAQVAYARHPGTQGVALAVYNRLLRSAAFKVVKV